MSKCERTTQRVTGSCPGSRARIPARTVPRRYVA
uniref:Uncharacterized protein n=1 Tax=Anguilla anguilla TaxID=7936 RepID=A0A0E9QYY0_ANGAN